MPSIQTASIPVTSFPNEYASPWGNDDITPLYSSVPLKSPVAGCLPCVVCGSSIDRSSIISNNSFGTNNSIVGGDNGKAVVTPLNPIFGCTNPAAYNYNPLATRDDGSCCFIAGCTNSSAYNYNPLACYDDGSCCFIAGCTNPEASNYNPLACYDDGSCIFVPPTSQITFNLMGECAVLNYPSITPIPYDLPFGTTISSTEDLINVLEINSQFGGIYAGGGWSTTTPINESTCPQFVYSRATYAGYVAYTVGYDTYGPPGSGEDGVCASCF